MHVFVQSSHCNNVLTLKCTFLVLILYDFYLKGFKNSSWELFYTSLGPNTSYHQIALCSLRN